jgi:predicted TIM-barrel fold metal-dependent hydrolase
MFKRETASKPNRRYSLRLTRRGNGRIMRNGYRIFDSDTHVNPAAEVLDRYVDPAFRPRLAELEPYRVPAGGPPGQPKGSHVYRVGTIAFPRILGQAEVVDDPRGPGRAKWAGYRDPRPGIQDDQPANRVRDMDDEGADAHLLVPTQWHSVVGLDIGLELGLVRAYHRYLDDFCGESPERLKGMLVASTRDVEEAVREIRAWGSSSWASSVLPLVPLDRPLDHPDHEPIWAEAEAHGLAVIHHSDTWCYPYFPGYRDVWDNLFLGRSASHPWGAMRFVAALIGAGILDRYPGLNVGLLECGFGWLPFWARRLDEQLDYVGATAPLKARPSEYFKAGRIYCSIELHEGVDTLQFVTSQLGDSALMFASDYPHNESHFPKSVDEVLAWSGMSDDTRRKLMWDNAASLLKLA